MWCPLLILVSVLVTAKLQLDPEGRILSLHKPNGNVLDLHAEWLRERCQSDGNVDIATKQPLVNPHDFDSPRVKIANLVNTTEAYGHTQWLRIEFSDGHLTTFEYDSLVKRASAELRGDQAGALIQTYQAPNVQRKPWGSSFKPPVIKYEHLIGDSSENEWTRLELTAHLLNTGLAIVRGAPKREGQCVELAGLLSTLRETEWGKTFDVKYNPPAKAAAKVNEEAQSNNSKDNNEGRADLAYSGHYIGMHTDNPYRNPMPDFQLLHAIDHCTCDMNKPGYEETKNCEECRTQNFFVDGLSIADRMAKETPELFDVLTTTNVRFENDGGGATSALYHIAPIFEPSNEYKMNGCSGAECVGSVRFSSKSGGYVPLGTENIDTFYTARRRFSEIAHDLGPEGLGVTLQLNPGDIAIFDNMRILHSRSAIRPIDGKRHLQGCYLNRDGLYFNQERLRRRVMQSGVANTVDFRSLAEGTKADFDLMTAAYVEACNSTHLTNRALGLLEQLNTPATKLGARISLYEHSLQTATRALRAGEDDETVVIALLHDVGELLSPSSHGDIANALLLPYISPKSQWVLKMHEIFQGYHYFHHVGGNRHQREDYKDHEFYEACKQFCDLYDQTSFDDGYVSLPIESFRPLVEKIFSRKPYWWQPDHPKASAVTGSSDK